MLSRPGAFGVGNSPLSVLPGGVTPSLGPGPGPVQGPPRGARVGQSFCLLGPHSKWTAPPCCPR